MPIVAVLGSLLLFVVVVVRPGKTSNISALVAAVAIAIVGVPMVLGVLVGRTSSMFPDALSEQLMRSALPSLQKAADDDPTEILLLEGASWSARGVDGALLESELASLGLDVAVIQVTLPGANYFERDFVLNQLASDLSAEQMDRLDSADMILIRELSPDYLNNPLAQVDRNLYTDRVYAYSSPRRSWQMNQTSRAMGSWTPQLAIQLAQHGAFNWLRIGEMQRLDRPQKREARDGYWPLDKTKEGMHTRAISEIIAFLESDQQPQFDIPPWIDILEAMGRNSYGLPIDSMVVIQPPNLGLSRSEYARWFSTQSIDPVILVDSELYEALDDVDLWFDTGHLRREGAEIYTSWLAIRIAELVGM